MAGSTRRRFDPEFRAGAVRIVKETGKPVSHVARDLGINEYTLHNWVQMDRHANGQAGGNGGGGGTLKESESEELARRFSHWERIPASPSRCAPVPTPGGTAGRIENCQIGRRRSDGPPQPDPREPFWAENTAVRSIYGK
ncbi:transposase [Microtetraspora malaysiensis]|uniref:Transposase n=1 Tax=Microtetraspora malaysiensis TaxID=161358 RepID=A0ABW6T098_9ACTN